MKKITLFRLSSTLGLLTSLYAPLSASAAGGIDLSYINPYALGITGVINYLLLPVLMAVAFIVFIYGVFKYLILGADSDEDRKTGRQLVMWGVIGFVVIFSVWSLVRIVMGTLGFSATTGAPPIPGAPKSGAGSNTETVIPAIIPTDTSAPTIEAPPLNLPITPITNTPAP